jgi:hypothetical protein
MTIYSYRQKLALVGHSYTAFEAYEERAPLVRATTVLLPLIRSPHSGSSHGRLQYIFGQNSKVPG